MFKSELQSSYSKHTTGLVEKKTNSLLSRIILFSLHFVDIEKTCAIRLKKILKYYYLFLSFYSTAIFFVSKMLKWNFCREICTLNGERWSENFVHYKKRSGIKKFPKKKKKKKDFGDKKNCSTVKW